MKKIIFGLVIIITSNFSYGQCGGGNTTGTHNDCFLNTSGQANINRLLADSILAGTKYYGFYYGPVIGEGEGGTGQSSFVNALAIAGAPYGSNAIAKSDSNIAYPTMHSLKDSIVLINNKIGLRLKISDTTGFAKQNNVYSKSQSNGLYKSIGYIPSWSDVTSKPSFATVATSGVYSDLSGKPTIYSFSGTNTQLTRGDGTYFTPSYLTAEVDGSVSNEIQNLSLSGTSLNISSGIGVILPQADWNQGTNTALDYIKNKPSIPSTLSAGTGISIVANQINNTAPDQTVSLTAGRGISITGTYPNFTIALVTPTISIVSRSIGSSPTPFTISSTKEAIATYTVTCSVTNPLLVGTSTATAYLEYSTNGGSTWLLPSQNGNSSGVGITVTLQLTNGQTGTLIGVIPANASVRIRTATSGTASVTYVTGQETVY